MFNNLTFTSGTENITSPENAKSTKMTYNGYTFGVLSRKRKNLERFKEYKNFIEENETPESLLYYSISKPFVIDKNNNKGQLTKEKLNELLSRAKKNDLKDIYKSPLYKLLNPYYIALEKKYVSINDINEENQQSLKKDKEDLLVNETAMTNDKFFDKETKAMISISSVEENVNEIISKSVGKKILVKLINQEDNFSSHLLLNPNTTISELKSIIKFLYHNQKLANIIEFYEICVYEHNNPDTLSETDYEDEGNNSSTTIKDICEKIKEPYEVDFYISLAY